MNDSVEDDLDEEEDDETILLFIPSDAIDKSYREVQGLQQNKQQWSTLLSETMKIEGGAMIRRNS